MMRGLARIALAAATGALVEKTVLSCGRGSARLERINFREQRVNLAGGVGVAASSALGAATAPGGLGAVSALTTAVAAGAGALDDFASDPGAAKGLGGHIKALLRGELTTGAVKLLSISGSALVAGGVIANRRGYRGTRAVTQALISGALIAGTANLINLFDLRPGRAVKISAILTVPLLVDSRAPESRALAQSALGVASAAAPRDLREVTMLGDVGANSLGALLGLAYAAHPNGRLRLGAVIAVTTLIVTSERVSFSRAIERTKVLSWLDHLGRTK